VLCLWREDLDRLDVATQLVGDHDPRLSISGDQFLQEAFRRLGIAAALHENIEYITVSIDCTPEPMMDAIDCDDDFVKMLFVVWPRPVAPNTGREMSAKPVHLEPDCFAADHNTALGQKILDIRSTHRKSKVCPDGKSDDLTRIAIALQARQR
jgi:hypothetical protein